MIYTLPGQKSCTSKFINYTKLYIIITFQILTYHTLTNEVTIYNSISCWPSIVCNNCFYQLLLLPVVCFLFFFLALTINAQLDLSQETDLANLSRLWFCSLKSISEHLYWSIIILKQIPPAIKFFLYQR